MANIKVKLFHLKLKGDYGKVVTQKLEQATRVAAREWLKAICIGVPMLPTWTGETRGSFAFARGASGFLGQFLNLQIPIIPTHLKVGHTPESGGHQGRYSFSSGQHKFAFYFRSDVVQWSINEFFDNPAGPEYLQRPWDLRKYGARAFRESMSVSLAKLPKVQDFLVKSTGKSGLPGAIETFED